MTTIASKNLYDLLGNDPELDPDREPEPPTKALDKPVARIGKRDAGPEKPVKDAATRPVGGAPRGGAREERGGSLSHRGGRPERGDGQRGDYRPRGEGRERRERGEYRGRGNGRGDRNGRDRGGAARNDRHSNTNVGEHEKQAAHGWGAEQDGNAELADERAGDAIATAESRNEPGFTPDANAADPAFADGPDDTRNGEAAAEAEDKTKSYDDYLAEQAAKRKALAGEGSLEFRKANEGSKQKFPEGKAFARDPEEENFMVGAGGKTRKAKEASEKKERVQLEGSYYAPHDSGDRGGRGGRGGARGGRGRGEGFRGGEGRGGRGGRGRGEGRGGPRGGAERGNTRGGAGFNATDDSAFPALGA